MLRLLTTAARVHYAYRWRYVAAGVGVVLILVCIFFVVPIATFVAIGVSGPLLSVAWGMALLCFWFGRPHGDRLRNGILGWAAVTALLVWWTVGVLVWPTLVFLS